MDKCNSFFSNKAVASNQRTQKLLLQSEDLISRSRSLIEDEQAISEQLFTLHQMSVEICQYSAQMFKHELNKLQK